MKNSIIEKTNNWLTNPKRTYVIGLALFNLCASYNMKKGYGAYLNDVDAEEIEPFDARFNLLINKVSAIHNNMKIDPEKYLDIDSENSSISKQVKSIVALNSESRKIESLIEELNGKELKVGEISRQLEAKSEELNQLNIRLENLKSDFSKNNDKFNEKSASVEKLTGQIGEKEQGVTTSKNQITELTDKIKILEESGEDKTKEIAALNKETKTLTTHNKKLGEEVVTLGKQLEAAKTERDNFETAAKDLDTQINELSTQIDELTDEKDVLDDQLQELQEESENKDSQIEELEKQLQTKSEEFDVLKKEIEGKGYNVVTENDLPEEYQAKKARIKEIVPLMAKIHAELSNPELTDQQRKTLAGELCTLDDERRDLWDDIDEYLSGKKEVLPDDKSLQYSDDPDIKEGQLALRIKRLKEKIQRNKESAIKHEKNNKPNYQAQALNRVIRYTAELAEIQLLKDETK